MNTLKVLTAIVLAISVSALAPGRTIAGNVPALWTEPDPIPKWITVDETSRIPAAVFYQVNNDTVARFSKIADESVFNAIDYLIEVVAGAKLGEFTVQLEMNNSDLLEHRCPETVFCWMQTDGLTAFSIPDMPLDLETRLTYFDGRIETEGASALIKVQPTITTVGVDVARHFLEYAVAKVIRVTAGSECLGSLQGEKIKLVWVFYSELLPVAELLARGEVSAAVSLVTPMVGRIWSKIVPSIVSLSEEAANCVAKHLNPYALFSRGAAFFAQVDFAAMVASAGTGVGASLPIVAAGDEGALEVKIGFNGSAISTPSDAPSASSSLGDRGTPSQRCDLNGRLKEFHAFWNWGDPPPEISKLNLEGCDYRGLTLVNADFRDTNLAGANFSGANLANAVFWNANLQDADFRNASLYSTDFDGANLSRANFANTFLHYTSFYSTINASWKDWSVTTLDGATRRFYPYLESANFSGATFGGASFEDAVLTNANFTNAVVEYGGGWGRNWYDGASFVNFKYTALGDFGGHSFVGTDFTGAEINEWACGLDLSESILVNVKLPACYGP